MGNAFDALKPMAAELKARHRERAEEKLRQEKVEQRIAQGTLEFLKEMNRTGVRAAQGVKLSAASKDADGNDKRAQHEKKKPAPVPQQTIADNKAVLAESLSDEADSIEFLESEDGLSFRRPEVGPDVPRDLRRGRWCVVGQLDLHGMFVEEAREAVIDFIRKSQTNERLCVRIIHGKGNSNPDRQSILKEKVRRWLKQFDAVVAFAEPYERDGGAGATIVRLKPLPHPSVRNARQNG